MKRNEIYCLMFHNTEIIKDKKITNLINYVKEKLK